MPKRSNDFQKLMFLYYTQMTETGLVEESKFLKNVATGEDSEVDVVIEARIASTDVVIGIECRGGGRRGTVEWVQQATGKHQFLPTNKLILIHKTGFTKGARKLAALHGVDLLSLEDAGRVDWAESIRQLKKLHACGIEFSVNKQRVVLNGPDGSLIDPPVSNEYLLLRANGNPFCTVQETVLAWWSENQTAYVGTIVSLEAGRLHPFELSLPFGEPVFMDDDHGTRHRILGLKVAGEMRVSKMQPFPVTRGLFQGAGLVYGTMKVNHFGEGMVVFSQRPGGPTKMAASLMVDGREILVNQHIQKDIIQT